MKTNKEILARAYKALEAAKSVATKECQNRLEEIQIHTEGYAEPGYSGEIVATGNWNEISKYIPENKDSFGAGTSGYHATVDDTPKRLLNLFEKMGIEVEWSDEWSTCSHCNKLVRTQADSYHWTPSFVIGDGEISCVECLKENAAEHLESLEDDYNTLNQISQIDPAKYGYKLAEQGFESGWHPGQNANPKAIAEELRAKGVYRFLFNQDATGQFDMQFSVWVHESEFDLLAEMPELDITPERLAEDALKD